MVPTQLRADPPREEPDGLLASSDTCELPRLLV